MAWERWINSSTLIGRANLARALLLEGKATFPAPGLAASLHDAGATDPDSAVELLTTLLLAVTPPEEARRELVAVASQAQGDENRRTAQLVHAITLLPEFQLN